MYQSIKTCRLAAVLLEELQKIGDSADFPIVVLKQWRA
jgi:hypothetical protein